MYANFKDEQILLLAALVMLLMVFIKLIMILAFRQSDFFSKKFAKSFFFYDMKKIRRTEEPRLKRYYKNSNRVNATFYSLITGSLAVYVGLHIIQLADYVRPHIVSIIASR